jgi:flavin-dependent dehydrogenase
MIVGGSAAQSGIGYGMHAGQICGDVAADAISKGNTSKSFLFEYRKRWNAAYRTEYYLGRFAMETLRKMTDKEIDGMMEVFEGEDLKVLSGSPFNQALQVSKMILKNNPSSIFSYRAIFRNK